MNNYIYFSNLKNYLKFFILVFIINFIIQYFTLNTIEFENGVYTKYLASMLSNYDFNIFNQFTFPVDRWMATLTYNHFDYHSPFLSVLLFIPYSFLALTCFIFKITTFPPFFNQQVFVSLTIYTGILTLFYIKKISLDFRYFIYYLLFFILMGTSYIAFLTPSEFSFIQTIFSFYILTEILQLSSQDISLSLSFAIGIFTLLKYDGFYYFISTSILFIFLKKHKQLFFNIFIFLICFSMSSITNSIRFNSIYLKNPILLTEHSTYIFYTLLGQNGFFIKSPFLIILIPTTAYQLIFERNLKIKSIAFITLFVFFSKAFSIATGLVPVADYSSSRVIISDMPFWAYLFYVFLKKVNSRTQKIFYLILFLLLIYEIYCIPVWIVDSSVFDFRLFYFPPLNFYSKFYEAIIRIISFYNFRFLKFYTIYIEYSVVSSVFLTINYYLFLKFFKNKYLFYLFLFLLSIALTFTGLNLLFNQKNAIKMIKNGDFKNTVVCRGPAIYYDEVIDMIEYGFTVEKIIHNPTYYKSLSLFQKNYLHSVMQNVLIDKTLFTKNLNSGIIRPSFWKYSHDFPPPDKLQEN